MLISADQTDRSGLAGDPTQILRLQDLVNETKLPVHLCAINQFLGSFGVRVTNHMIGLC